MAELTYFDGRGLGEIVRIVMSVAKISWTETSLVERAQMEKLLDDGTLMFNQVPLLKIDGLNLVQSGAIVRYLGMREGLAGSTPEDRARCDMLFEGARDFYKTLAGFGFMPEDAFIAGSKKSLTKYLPLLEKQVGEKEGYLVGSKISIADCAVYEVLRAIEDYQDTMFKDYPDELKLGHYPKLLGLYNRIKADDRIKQYEAKVRKPISSPEYVATVKRVLAF